jgi:hypothetical protein
VSSVGTNTFENLRRGNRHLVVVRDNCIDPHRFRRDRARRTVTHTARPSVHGALRCQEHSPQAAAVRSAIEPSPALSPAHGKLEAGDTAGIECNGHGEWLPANRVDDRDTVTARAGLAGRRSRTVASASSQSMGPAPDTDRLIR